MNKQQLRAQVQARRRALTPEWVATRSRDIQEAVLALPEFAAARTVALYLAIDGEVETGLLVEACFERGKAILVPAWDTERQVYRAARLDALEACVAGPMGVPEPGSPAWTEMKEADLICVPGLAFDLRGSRVGYGGGHYDRMLGALETSQHCRVGLAFDFQVSETLERAEHDVLMDILVTESRIVRCENGEIKERMTR